MKVITFYSYKGGVGRTLACANFGLYLAKTGQKVFLVDMDFEAPGLDSKFPNIDITKSETGIIDQFHAFLQSSPIPKLKAQRVPLPDDVEKAGGSLGLIPAGNYLESDYFEKLSNINWDCFLYDETGMAFCLDLLQRIEAEFEPDVLVIDSPNGLSKISGLCTQIYPDTVLLFTSASPESLNGTDRIYKKIKNSPLVKTRMNGLNSINMQIVVSRIPRPDDLAALDQAMKKRLGLDIDRLFYLFNQPDLSYEDYLAVNRVEDRPNILEDYVELFSSLASEIIGIEKRLELFRRDITRRSLDDNRWIIKELLTLYPQPDVFLEAARFYRLIKDGDKEALRMYLRYLDINPKEPTIFREFIQLCETMPTKKLQPKEKIVQHLTNHGLSKLPPKLVEKYHAMSNTPK
ncbi:AAA family ATPase [bacterium]|nr:AAA family ATPase [bacterium]